jgi:hypothetical protein
LRQTSSKIKKYFLQCLIFLQLIAPFIHAHAFGHDSFKEHIFHVHSDEISTTDFNVEAIQTTKINQPYLVGAVFTVASGIKQSLSDDIENDIASIAIVFIIVLLLFNILIRLIPYYFRVVNYQRIAYSLQNPRAPPR